MALNFIDEEDLFEPPEFQPGVPKAVMPQAPGISSMPPAPPTEFERAQDALAGLKADKPQLPKPKWWQKALAAGFGGAAGYTNAAGRTRPIDIETGADAIQAPGYQRQLSDWQNRVGAAQAAADAEKEKQSSWWKNRELTSTEDRNRAQAEADKSHGDYWKNRSQMEQNQWKMDAKGRIINTVTGEVKNPAPTPKERFDEAKALGVDDESARFYALNGKMPEPKPERSRGPISVAPGHTVIDPETGKPMYHAPDRPEKDKGSPSQFRFIETKKGDRLMRAERDAKRRVQNGEDQASVMAELEGEKQRIQDAYEAEIQASGGSAEHREYSDETPAPKPKPASSPSAPKTYTEADVRKAAIARGKDPEAAINLARQRGVIQ